MSQNCPYMVLGVPRTATADEVKKAYRALALRHHPDKNHNNEAASARMQDITAAYAVLSDPERKRSYDASLQFSSAPHRHPYSHARFQATGAAFFGGFRSFGFEGFSDLFSDFDSFPARARPQPQSCPQSKQPPVPYPHDHATRFSKHGNTGHQGQMPQAQSQQPPNASAPRSKRTKPNSAEKNGYSTVPPAFTPLASSASHPPADSSFWSDSKDRQHTITLRTTLENLFKSSSKTLNITRTIYVVAPRTSSSLSKKTTYLPQQDRQQVSIQLNATKHYDGCTILLPGLGDQIHPSNAPASFLKRGSGRPQSSLQFKDLVLTLKVQPHPTLSRTLQDKDNLIGQLTVTKRVAAAGCAGVTFVGIDGRLLDCSSGNVHLKDGDSFVIKNEGWVKENGTGRGDLVLSVKVLPGLDDDEEDGMSHPEDGQDKEEEVDRGARKEDVGKMNDELLNGKASETGFRKRKRGESDFEQQEEEDLIGLTDPRNRDGHRKGGMDVRSESNGSVKPTHDTATTQPWMLYAEETSCESEGFDLDLDFLGGRMWTSAAREPQVSSNTENRKYPRDTSIHAPSQDSTPSAEESSKLTSTPMTEQKPQNHLRNANSKDLEDGQHNETQFSRFPLFSGKPRRKLSSQSKTPPSGHENDIASPCKDEVEATKKQNSKQKKRGVSLQGRFGPYTILGGNGGKDDPLEID